jgi:DNA-binding transcriptional LysR family regulator
MQQMRLFAAVAEHRSITRAAQEVNLTQPSVSMQVKALEEKIGLPLTEQIGKKMHLTQAGEEVYETCRDILGRLAEMETALSDFQGEVAGPLKIAVVSSAKYSLPHLLGSFVRRYPKVTPHLEISNRATLLERLGRNQDDLYIMGMAPDELAVIREPFLENVIVPVARSDNPLAVQKGISLRDLTQEPIIGRESGSGTRKAVERVFAGAGAELNFNIVLDDAEAIKQGVIGGLGIAFLSLHSLRLELEGGALAVLDVEGFPLRRRWYAVRRQGKRLSKAATVFLNFLLEEGEDEVAHLLTNQNVGETAAG